MDRRSQRRIGFSHQGIPIYNRAWQWQRVASQLEPYSKSATPTSKITKMQPKLIFLWQTSKSNKPMPLAKTGRLLGRGPQSILSATWRSIWTPSITPQLLATWPLAQHWITRPACQFSRNLPLTYTTTIMSDVRVNTGTRKPRDTSLIAKAWSRSATWPGKSRTSFRIVWMRNSGRSMRSNESSKTSTCISRHSRTRWPFLNWTRQKLSINRARLRMLSWARHQELDPVSTRNDFSLVSNSLADKFQTIRIAITWMVAKIKVRRQKIFSPLARMLIRLTSKLGHSKITTTRWWTELTIIS